MTKHPTLAARMTAAAKREFGRRVEALMVRRGWNNSELARRATAFLPSPARGQIRHKQIGRDTIGPYKAGATFPNPVYLEALAKALAVTPEELVPLKLDLPGPDNIETMTPFSIVSLGDGRSNLRINRTVSMKTAMAIVRLLEEEDQLDGPSIPAHQ